MKSPSVLLVAGLGVTNAFMVAPTPGAAVAPAARVSMLNMMAGKGDLSKETQPERYEQGTDFLFFQSPAPKTSGGTGFFDRNEEIPSFFSAENFQDIEIKPAQIAVTATGIGSFLAVASVVVA